MARKTPFPHPPGDLNERDLKLVEVRDSLYRIHDLKHTAIYFRKTDPSSKDYGYRFDDPKGEFGVLYAAVQEDGAFAEVFLRELSSKLIDLDEVILRGLSELHLSPLRCVDLTGEVLRGLGCDNRIATETDYEQTQMWSRALHDHPDEPDGLIYLSRHDPQFRCLAVFDRAKKKIRTRRPTQLISRMDWIAERLEAYQLGVAP
jgi:RES domain